jgi:hypothetical protein
MGSEEKPRLVGLALSYVGSMLVLSHDMWSLYKVKVENFSYALEKNGKDNLWSISPTFY